MLLSYFVQLTLEPKVASNGDKATHFAATSDRRH